MPSRPGPHRPPVARRASEHTEGSAETHSYCQECISGRGPHRWAPEPPLLTCAPRAGPSPSASPLCSHMLPRQRSRFNPEDPVPRICFTRGSRRPLTCSTQTHLLPHPDVCSLPGVSHTQQPSLHLLGFYQTRGQAGTDRCRGSDPGRPTSFPRWSGGGSCGRAVGPPAWPRSARPGSPASPRTGPSQWTGT